MMGMQKALASFRLLVTVSLFAACVAQAQDRLAQDNAQEARVWLGKMQSAPQRLNYSGTFVYQQGSQLRSSRIAHLLDGETELEKLEILDGTPREYIRSNEEVICYVPETRTLQVEKRATRDVFPALLSASAEELGEYYELRVGESGRVAGRPCQAIMLQPKDRMRYGYKLWADKATGLLLRAQTLNARGEVVEQIAFTQISLGGVDRSHVRPSHSDTSDWRVEQAVTEHASLSGWSVKRLPPGFRKIREVRRMISERPAAGTQTVAAEPGREIGQVIFSDGLAAISVFIEPGSHSRTEGTLRQGALNIMGKRYGDYWLTVVGEVPPNAIREVANSIEFKPASQ